MIAVISAASADAAADQLSRAAAASSIRTRAVDLGIPIGPPSLSCGRTGRGGLSHAAVLPYRGKGFVIPEPWRSRGLRYGTDQLVGLIKRAAARVAATYPGAVLGVADLAKAYGGPAEFHRSHQSGRDADLLYYAVDLRGKPLFPDSHMPLYGRGKRAHRCESPERKWRIPVRYFDVKANWAFIKAVLTDRYVAVERVFMSRRIIRWLLEHAKKTREPRWLIRRARKTLLRPRDSRAHADHMHLRIACDRADALLGRCIDLEMRRDKDKRKLVRELAKRHRQRWNGRVCR